MIVNVKYILPENSFSALSVLLEQVYHAKE